MTTFFDAFFRGRLQAICSYGWGLPVQRMVVDLSNCKYGKRRTEERRHERGAKNPAQRGLWLEISLASFGKLRHLHSGGHTLHHYE